MRGTWRGISSPGPDMEPHQNTQPRLSRSRMSTLHSCYTAINHRCLRSIAMHVCVPSVSERPTSDVCPEEQRLTHGTPNTRATHRLTNRRPCRHWPHRPPGVTIATKQAPYLTISMQPKPQAKHRITLQAGSPSGASPYVMVSTLPAHRQRSR